MRKPFDGNFALTQDWNDKRYRSSYAQFGILGHNGEDYGVPLGTRIVAPHGGKIIEAQFDPGYGFYVKIEDQFQGSVLAHLSKISPKVGDVLIERDEIGFSGNTGNSTAPHLHWGYYRLPRNRENGFLGYIDQSDWMNIPQASSNACAMENAKIAELSEKNKTLELEKGKLSAKVENAKIALQ